MDNFDYPDLVESIDIDTDCLFDSLGIDDILFTVDSPLFWEW